MAPESRSLLKDILIAVLLALLISIAGAAWIDYSVPGAWPDLIGPTDWGPPAATLVPAPDRGP
jgi:hypothetical protein